MARGCFYHRCPSCFATDLSQTAVRMCGMCATLSYSLPSLCLSETPLLSLGLGSSNYGLPKAGSPNLGIVSEHHRESSLP